ncbi:hypothetical protein AB0918_33250 [Streptomyces sp. NPDC006864]|uniref:hypothetical protein n=1 Tax=Streptomyces sp. NPDC006864 TaxID=3154780 RepID=UPI0034560ED7
MPGSEGAARPGANVMVDLLLPGPGHDQCAQWEEHWAPPLLAQLCQGALGNSALRAIVDRVCEDPQVRALWDRTADLRRHAYGTTRPMYLDGWRPRPAWVRIMGWQPMHEPSLRVITGEPATSLAAARDKPLGQPGHESPSRTVVGSPVLERGPGEMRPS